MSSILENDWLVAIIRTLTPLGIEAYCATFSLMAKGCGADTAWIGWYKMRLGWTSKLEVSLL